MRDPFEVLGINRNATEEEVKQRHRELAKKYHPDRYQGNPLSDLAEEKLSEINEAYDRIMKGFREANSGSSNSGQYNGSYKDPIFLEIRKALDNNDLKKADTLLNSVIDRGAEWYFLSGILSYKRGWMDDAVSKVQNAVKLDPNNEEYKTVLSQMVGVDGFFYNANRKGYRLSDNECCETLACYCCIDSLCDCI